MTERVKIFIDCMFGNIKDFKVRNEIKPTFFYYFDLYFYNCDTKKTKEITKRFRKDEFAPKILKSPKSIKMKDEEVYLSISLIDSLKNDDFYLISDFLKSSEYSKVAVKQIRVYEDKYNDSFYKILEKDKYKLIGFKYNKKDGLLAVLRDVEMWSFIFGNDFDPKDLYTYYMLRKNEKINKKYIDYMTKTENKKFEIIYKRWR